LVLSERVDRRTLARRGTNEEPMISRMTAYILASRDDLLCTYGGPAENGKYLGWITLPSEQRCRPLLNTEPVYDSPEQATEAMRALQKEVTALINKETGGKHPIDHELGEEMGAIVKRIVSGAKSP
jgi:hypothetical protein